MKKFLTHLFFPHESNSHRAKVLHIDSLLIVIALLLFSFSVFSPVQQKFPSILGISTNITETQLLDITNKIRKEHGLQELKLDPELSQAAANKASDMFKKNYWAHIAPDGATPWAFINNSGYEYLYAGENLARGFDSAQDAVEAWMESPTHRDNMLSSNYNDVGFAVATGSLTDSDTVLIVEMFGTKYNSPDSQTENELASLKTTEEVSESPSQLAKAPEIMANKTNSNENKNQIAVASLQQKPLINKIDLTSNIIYSVIILFIGVLIIDIIIIERRKIVRLVSHSFDHLIYLVIILLIISIVGKSSIL